MRVAFRSWVGSPSGERDKAGRNGEGRRNAETVERETNTKQGEGVLRRGKSSSHRRTTNKTQPRDEKEKKIARGLTPTQPKATPRAIQV